MRASDSLAYEDTPPHGNVVRRMGRYMLCRELGVGGMARVHLARIDGEAGFAKLVALKSIHPHLAGEQTFVDMFLDEARLASQINHRNVCAVFDFGRAEGTYYLAMEYLVGEPLSRIFEVMRSAERPVNLEELPQYAARLIADAAEGLHAAHELCGEDGSLLGVVHRDVSPQNLFVTFDGTAKVVDFGCAKAAQRISHTDTGILKGKVSYAAPEQMRQGVVDRRADIWSLGVCLWELLTLERLFNRHSDIASAMAVLDDPIPFASDGRPWIPTDLATIVDRALARDPAERYATMRDFSRDLRTWLARNGHAIDSAELAEWMDRLFAGVHDEQLAIVEEARSAVMPQLAAAINSEPRGPRLSVDDDGDARPRKRSGGAGVALIVVLLLGLGAGGAWAWQTGQLDAWLGRGPPPVATPREPIVEPPLPEPEPLPELAAAGTDPATPEPGVEAPVDPAAALPTEPTAVIPPADPSIAPAVTGTSVRSSGRDRNGPTTTVAFGHSSSRGGASSATTGSATPPVEPPAGAVTTGSVRIEASGGWSDVYEGDRHLGRTPLTVQLPAGPHVLRLLPFGNEPGSTQTVRVSAGAEVGLRLAIRDTPETAPPPPTPPTPPPSETPE